MRDDWMIERLEELVYVDPEQINGSADPNLSFYYIDISSVSEGRIEYPSQQIKLKEAPSRARKIIRSEDILMSSVRPNLKSFALFKAKENINYIASTGFAVLRAKSESDIKYVYFSLFSNFLTKQIETLVVGSNYPAINTSDVKKLKIQVPPLPQQRKIARILSTCDAVIEKTEAAIAKYQAIKQGMMHDLFTRGIDLTTGQLRPKYEDAPHLYKPSELGWIPKEWEVKRLSDMTKKIGSGITPTGGSEVYLDSGILFIRSQNVLKGNLSLADAAYISKDIDEKMTGSRVLHYDVLLNITGASIGRCAFFPSELANANVNQHVCIIRFDEPSKEKALFMSEYFNSDFGQSQIFKFNAGGNREGLNFQQLGSFIIPDISEDEIYCMSDRIQSLKNKLLSEQAYLSKYRQLKAGLMQDLLTGKVGVGIESQLKEDVV